MDNFSAPTFANDALLDNPIWNSLRTEHAPMALVAGLARRYPAEVGPLAGFAEPGAEAYAALAELVPAGDVAVLFLKELPVLPAGWELVRGGTLVQMVCPRLPAEPALAEQIVPMERADFAEMVELATLTEPGPFRAETATLGGFLGIRVDGRLAAMAGRRTAPTGFVEVSAVCTHPEFRGRGYAAALVAAVTRGIWSEGKAPFLTAFEANTGAIRVYEQVGFVLRRKFELAAIRAV